MSKLTGISRKPRREIVDGQQRLITIFDFVEDKFALGKNSREFDGKRFSELLPEQQDAFWAYAVSADVIRNADKAEILQMFRAHERLHPATERS